MTVVIILLVLGFAALICIAEVPKLLKAGLFKEFWAFTLLLSLGVVLSILRSFKIAIGNPSDVFVWMYSPLEGIMKSLLTNG